MLTNGTCGLESYTAHFLSSPALASARQRVSVVADLTGPVADVALDVTDANGCVHHFEDNDLPGTPAMPLKMNRIEQKFLSNALIAISVEDAETFMRSVASLDISMERPWSGWRDAARAATAFATS
jgi:hypothetical protein